MTTPMAIAYLVKWTLIFIHSLFMMVSVRCQRCCADKVISNQTIDLHQLDRLRDGLKVTASECRVSRKALILVNAILLFLFGTASLVMVYFYLDATRHVQRYELIVCFYCLVAVVSWFVAMDCIRYYRQSHCERIKDRIPEQIGSESEDNVEMRRKGTNPFEESISDEHPPHDDEWQDSPLGKSHNAWAVPPTHDSFANNSTILYD